MPPVNLNKDIFGIGEAVSDTPNPEGDNLFETIFDESVTLDKYNAQTDIQMVIPPLDVETYTCEDTCKEKNKVANEKCKVLRKRVEAAMKKAGCPTRLVALKRPGCGSTKTAPKKKKTTRKRG